METIYLDWRSLPDGKASFSDFLSSYPSYRRTMVIDSLRHNEYPHLDDKGQVCLDYTGVGLFSSLQRILGPDSSSIGLSYTAVNLATHAMYTEEGTTESLFRKRILYHMNLHEKDYYIVFTVNSFSAFKLLGESYPFHEAQNLFLAYNHQCENLDGISECARSKEANVLSAHLSWPGLNIDVEDLKKKLQGKRRCSTQKPGTKGLFVYPVFSRVTGSKNPLKWISEAQANGWHVLLDVTTVAAKTLGSLGLSVFLPDFILCSFYYVFGQDPQGFGCLLIKKSVLRTLGDSSRARAVGMVNIVPKQTSALGTADPPLPVHLANTTHILSMDDCADSRYVSSLTPSENFADSRHEDIRPSSRVIMHADKHTQASNDRSVESIESMVHFASRNGFYGSSSSREQASASSLAILGEYRRPLPGKFSKSITNERCEGQQRCYGQGSILKHAEHSRFPISSARLQSVWKGLSPDNDGSVSNSKYAQEDNRQVESLGFQSMKPTIPDNNGRAVKQVENRRRNIKGLFYGECIALQTAEYAVSTVTETLKDYEKTSSLEKLAQRVDTLDPATFVNACSAFDLMDKKPFSSTSQKGKIPVSAPCSPSRVAGDDIRESASAVISEGLDRGSVAIENMEADIICKGLDHADMVGCKRIAVRIRSLMKWLSFSLLRLRHPMPGNSELVRMYSPMSQAICGSTIAFTLLDAAGNSFEPKRVQMLADRSSISLRTGVIEGLLLKKLPKEEDESPAEVLKGCVDLAAHKLGLKGDSMQTERIPVLYAALGFLNSFSDVYRLWVFVSQFLDPKFVEQELWQYRALNQETVEI